MRDKISIFNDFLYLRVIDIVPKGKYKIDIVFKVNLILYVKVIDIVFKG